MRRGPHVSGWGLPSQQLTGVNPVNWATRTHWQRPRGGHLATSADGAGTAPASQIAAARGGLGSGLAHRGSQGPRLLAFDAARRRASNGGGAGCWGGRSGAPGARRRRGGSGVRQRRGYGANRGKPKSGARSTRCGQGNGGTSGTKRLPWPRRRRGQAAEGAA